MMVGIMKSVMFLLGCLQLAAAAEPNAVRTVYLLPMGHGLDQFVANSLTRTHLLQVVTDPGKADTILTDHVGDALESQLKDLYPPPAPPAAPTKNVAKEKEVTREKEIDAAAGDETNKEPERGIGSLLKDPVYTTEKTSLTTPPGHGHGTIFLIDVKSRQVLWSDFERPKNTSPNELDHTAQRIVKRLKQDLTSK
jgi:hypothetical protein